MIGEACRGKDVIFVGTCGVFHAFTKPMLVRATEASWSPTCERLGMSYTVRDTAPPVTLPEPPAWARGLPDGGVLCSPGISLVSRLPDGVAPDTVVENLELYSIAAEIAQSAGTLAVILAVTNAVGSDSHQQWRQHFASAAGQTAEFIAAKV